MCSAHIFSLQPQRSLLVLPIAKSAYLTLQEMAKFEMGNCAPKMHASKSSSVTPGGKLPSFAQYSSLFFSNLTTSRRVKRVVTQDSTNYFLTVSEDQTVRGHDLRTPHTCPADCPLPLLRMPYPLSTLATSPLAPWLIVVAGQSPFAHLFDRRMIRRILQSEWGVPEADHDVNCVRRFGRTSRAPGELAKNEHISGSRMSQMNGHEVRR